MGYDQMLKSGINLKENLFDFIKISKNIIIFSPFIKLDALKYLLSESNNCKQIIVRWLPKDIIDGVSDLEIYDFCKKRGISLFRNPKIHLKVFLSNFTSCVLGSANITDKALAISSNIHYNYELCSFVEKIDLEDKLYLQNIISESTLITDSIFLLIKENLDKYKTVAEKDLDFDFHIVANKDHFLISELPMSDKVDKLWDIYSGKPGFSDTDINCAIHDISIYKIPPNLDKPEFFNYLKLTFFNHEFITSFLDHVKSIGGEIYFGAVKEWFQKNTTSVPIPRRWELTENIQILYKWLVTLNPSEFKVDRPNYSDRLKISTKI